MRKLLVLMLVLGLASIAHAAIDIELSVDGVYDGTGNVTQIEIPICTTIVIDVKGAAGLDYGAYLIIEGNSGQAGGEWVVEEPYPRVLAGAGDIGSMNEYSYPDWGFGYELTDAQGTGENPGGTAFEALYHCTGPDSTYVTISLWDSLGTYEAPEDVIVVHQIIPEPMTIALLGLGGLFLRRRR